MLTAPLAQADPGNPAPTTSAPAAKGIQSANPTTTATPLAPNYGVQKLRVGIAVKSGAVVPAGTSLAGAKLQVTTSAVGAPFNQPATTATCTTGTDGFCDTSFGQSQSDGTVTLLPGQSAVVTQLTAPAGLVADPSTLTQPPCDQADCQTSPPATLVFQDPGLPPKAAADTARVVDGRSVVINVLANDSNDGAPITSIAVTRPGHGTAVVAGTTIRYTPAAGFSGTDRFSYTITTANGSATAAVRVSVAAAAPTTSAPAPTPTPTASAAAASSSSAPELAATGAAGAQPLAWTGGGLVTAGALALFAGRRRFAAGRRH